MFIWKSRVLQVLLLKRRRSIRNPRLHCSHALNRVGCMKIYHRLSKSIKMDKDAFKIIRILQKTYISRIKTHTFDPNVHRLILIDVDNSKVTVDFLNTMIFHLMPQTLILAHFQWRGRLGGGYGSQYLWMVDDKSYGNPNP